MASSIINPLVPANSSSCEAYPFLNDRWRPEAIARLRSYVGIQTTPKEKAAALVIGSGGLPYILAHINVSKLIVADLHEEVIKLTLERVAKIADHDSWNPYHEEIWESLNEQGRIGFGHEIKKAHVSGLLGPYSVTKANLALTSLEGWQGDIIDNAAGLGGMLKDSGYTITFANLTNAAEYARDPLMPQANGRLALRIALGALPTSQETIIVDSSYFLTPDVHLLEDYPQAIDLRYNQLTQAGL